MRELPKVVSPRPRPIRNVVNNTAAVGGIAFAIAMGLPALLDILPQNRLSEATLDWLRFVLGAVALLAGIVAGYRTENRVRQEVTPLEDPRGANMEPLLTPAEWAQRYEPSTTTTHNTYERDQHNEFGPLSKRQRDRRRP